MKHLRMIFVLLLLAMLIAPALVSEQAVSATLVGTITDASGAVVVNAKVTVNGNQHRCQPQRRTPMKAAITRFPNLPPGTYAVTAEQTGFKKASRVRAWTFWWTPPPAWT